MKKKSVHHRSGQGREGKGGKVDSTLYIAEETAEGQKQKVKKKFVRGQVRSGQRR